MGDIKREQKQREKAMEKSINDVVRSTVAESVAVVRESIVACACMVDFLYKVRCVVLGYIFVHNGFSLLMLKSS